MKKFLIYLLCILLVTKLSASSIVNLDIATENKKYVSQNQNYYHNYDEADLNDIYAIVRNYKYFDIKKKAIAQEYFWELKLKNLPLDQQVELILFKTEVDMKNNLLNKLNSFDSFLYKYHQYYLALSHQEKINLIKFNITGDKQFLTPEVAEFLEIRNEQSKN